MNNHPSQALSPMYPYSVVHKYSLQPYYYTYDKYQASPASSRTYITLPRDQHSSSALCPDEEVEFYLSEYYHCHNNHHHHHHHHHSHRPNHGQHYNTQRSNRAHNISSQIQQPSLLNETPHCSIPGQQGRMGYESRDSMTESEFREYMGLKRDLKRPTTTATTTTTTTTTSTTTTINNNNNNNNLYKPLTPVEFLAKTHSEIRQEFRRLPNPPPKDTHAAKEERNIEKNRYRDVLPGEATRVKLQPDSDEKSDFINANYVSGHDNNEKAYIFSQGPLQTTVKDFWRLVWQQDIAIIVMTTNIREAGTMKCFPYWPMESKEILNIGLYQIQNEKSEKFDSFVVTTLSLKKKNQPDTRTIYHAHYLKWPDHGVPSNTKDALSFLEQVENYRLLSETTAPILLHCSAGIGRTGTFCAIDIGIKRYLEKKIIDMPTTVFKMRTERAGSVQTEDQYLFAYLALMDYIRQHQALQERINEPTNIIETSNGTKSKDNQNSNDIDDHLRKTARLKANAKKSNDLEQRTTLPMDNSTKSNHLQEPTAQRGKTLSDSSVAAIQHVTPSANDLATEPIRQRSSTEHISPMPTTTGNLHHKKARK